MRAVAEKPHDGVVKFDTYRNVQRHRAVLPAIARLLFVRAIVRKLITLDYSGSPAQISYTTKYRH